MNKTYFKDHPEQAKAMNVVLKFLMEHDIDRVEIGYGDNGKPFGQVSFYESDMSKKTKKTKKVKKSKKVSKKVKKTNKRK